MKWLLRWVEHATRCPGMRNRYIVDPCLIDLYRWITVPHIDDCPTTAHCTLGASGNHINLVKSDLYATALNQILHLGDGKNLHVACSDLFVDLLNCSGLVIGCEFAFPPLRYHINPYSQINMLLSILFPREYYSSVCG